MANRYFNKQVSPKGYAAGGAVKAAVKAVAKSKAGKSFSKSLSKAKERMFKDLGLKKEYDAAMKSSAEGSFGEPFRSKMKAVEKKARKKLGIGDKEGVFSMYKKMREKYGLKGDVPTRGAGAKGKTFEERLEKISKKAKEK